MAFRTRIKVCGLTRPADAAAAAAAGADALGVIFAPSPRCVTPEQAAGVLAGLPPFVSKVGVFVDADPHDIAEIADELGLSHVQLHGSETPEYCWRMPVPVIKALHVTPDVDVASLAARFAGSVSALLLDGAVPGSGVPFEWAQAADVMGDPPVIISGGLKPSNVAECVRATRPYAVDVSSGVEASPGIKDASLIAEFCAAVRAADAEAAP